MLDDSLIFPFDFQRQVYNIAPVPFKLEEFGKREYMNYQTMEKKHQRAFPKEIQKETQDALRAIRRNFTIGLINQPSLLRKGKDSTSLTDRYVRDKLFSQFGEIDEEEELNKTSGPVIYSPKIPEKEEEVEPASEDSSMILRESEEKLILPKKDEIGSPEELPFEGESARFGKLNEENNEEENSKSTSDYTLPQAPNGLESPGEKPKEVSRAEEFEARRFEMGKSNLNSPVANKKAFVFKKETSEKRLEMQKNE